MLRLAEDPRLTLASALLRAGVVPGPDADVQAREQAMAWGAHEASLVRAVVGARTWRATLARMRTPDPEAVCERVLGYGAATARFLQPPGLGEGRHALAVRLGARANLLVGLFDHFVDHGVAPGGLLPERAVAGPSGAAAGVAAWGLPGPRRFFARLAADWSEGAARMAGPAPSAAQVALLHGLHRLVRSMYRAELGTVGAGVPRPIDLRLKARLPFQVMAFPAWLARPEGLPAARARHLRWAGRVGDAVGLLDDVVDLMEDEVAGRRNLAAERAAASPGGVATVASHVARDLHSLLDERARLHGGTSPPGDVLPFLASLASWVTSPMLRAAREALAEPAARTGWTGR